MSVLDEQCPMVRNCVQSPGDDGTMTAKPRHALLTSVKDEGPYILEFVAYHRLMGFEQHHFASNDCSDGTDILLDALAAQNIITHTRNPLKPGQIPQGEGYKKIRAAQNIDQADWVMALDVDEFLQIETGAGQIHDLTALAPADVDIIALNAVSFGTSSEISWQPGLVTEQFTLRLPLTDHRNAPLKSLSRGHGRFDGIENHHPVGFQDRSAPLKAMLGSGEVIVVPDSDRPYSTLRSRNPTPESFGLGFYNHYPIKSLEAYCLRQQRGRGAHAIGKAPAPRHTQAYWATFASADITDRRIADRHGRALQTEIDCLLALPGIAKAQRLTQQRHRIMLDNLLND